MSSLTLAQSDTMSAPLTSESFTSSLCSTTTVNGDTEHNKSVPPLPELSQPKKWSLLALLSLGLFVDIWSYSAFYVLTGPISSDLSVAIEQQSWVITSYAATFCAFLLFWGRVSDLVSAKSVFSFNFMALGILNLVISFLPDKYSFFVVRVISGIAGAALIPASYRLIVAIFEPQELCKAFIVYGISSVLANTSGIVVAALLEFIANEGQMVAWRWFFRTLAAVILPFAFGSLYWIPAPRPRATPLDNIWKRLDLVGSLSMLSGILLLILSLTLGASDGWRTPGVLVPFLLAFLLFPFFFIWESRIPAEHALLPPATWHIPNFGIFIAFALYIYAWWSLTYLPFIETFIHTHGDDTIVAAARMLPQGFAAGAMTIFLTVYPQFVAHPRWPITLGMIAGFAGYILFIFSEGMIGDRYWIFTFTGSIIGSAGTSLVFTATNAGIMTAVPPEMAGVAGAVLQVALQVGSAVALSIQAGLLTVEPGNNTNWVNVRASFIFVLGWGMVWLVGFLVFYRPVRKFGREEEAQRENKVVPHM